MIVSVFVAMAILGCSEKDDEVVVELPKEEKIGADDLKEMMRKLQEHVLAGDDEMAIEMAQRLFPTQQTLSMACIFDANPDRYQKVSAWIESVKPRDQRNYLKIYPFRPWQTEIKVSLMTGAELASGEGDLEGFHEQAGVLAKTGLLRPDQEFYSVEFRKPVDEVGQRFEVFVWDSDKMVWKMLGPIWRALSHSSKV